MREVISAAEAGKFSEFSDKVKTSLEDKLRNNPTIVQKSAEFQNLTKMKDIFSQIKPTEDTQSEPSGE